MRKTAHCSKAGHLLPARLLSIFTAGAMFACVPATSAQDDVERPDLKFGFIKLTDCAPLVIAKELGHFEDEGLYVTLEAQANWKILLDRVITGELDGAHMLAGQPIAAIHTTVDAGADPLTDTFTGAAAEFEQPAGLTGSMQNELVATGLPIRPVLSTGTPRRLSRENRLREATSNLDPHAQQ